MHGGAAPQVQKSARERLAELFEPAITALRNALRSGDHLAAVRAATYISDRVVGRSPLPIEVKDITPAKHEAEDWSRLTDAELELLEYLVKKARAEAHQNADLRTTPLVNATRQWLKLIAGDDQMYLREIITIDHVPRAHAQKALTRGQGVIAADTADTSRSAAGGATAGATSSEAASK